MSLVSFSSVTKGFGGSLVLDDLNFDVAEGDLAVLFGAPGSGKSVLLRMLVGLEVPDRGTIYLRGADTTTMKPGDRNIGYVPQSFALFPNRSVAANIGYPLTERGAKLSEVLPSIEQVAELLDISQFLDRDPTQLSGGQKQRVAIARGLVKDTELFVLDDPLVGLDFKLREKLVDDLRHTREALGATFIYATSDAGEALSLGTNIAIVADGGVLEAGDPFGLYQTPQQQRTMTDLCFPAANVISGELRGTGEFLTEFSSELGTFGVRLADSSRSFANVVAIVRPEHVLLQPPTSRSVLSGTALVALREDLGAEEVIYLDTGGGELMTAILRADSANAAGIELGETLEYSIEPSSLVLFANNARIGSGT